MNYYNILYKGRIIYKEVTEDECRVIMLELSEHVADNKIDLDLIEMEAI
jgi:hypothetical protein